MATNTPLQSILLTSSTSTIVFSNIDQNYTDLVLVVSAKVDTGLDIWLRCNGDSASNYGYTALTGNGTSPTSVRSTNVTEGLLADWDGVPKPTFGHVLTFTLNNYSNTTTYKTSLARSNRGDSGVDFVTSTWRNTNAITNLTLRASNGSRTFDAGTTVDLYGIKSGAQKAFGGDVVATDGNYWYHAFKSTGTFTPQYPISCDVLVVAGGGGGGSGIFTNGNGGGGGGAGGLAYSTGNSVSSAQTVTIGAGGAGGNTSTGVGASGVNSVFGSLTAAVGGGGGGAESAFNNGFNGRGSNGGSGGGNSENRSVATGTAGQGNNGGNATGSGGAGGGGAGAVGGTGATDPGAGGAGVNTYSAFLSATGLGVSGYIAGGGGGGKYNSGAGGAGGSGGGGTGGSGGTDNDTAGTVNTGSGGGGSSNQAAARAGSAGGSGLVIVRYAV